MSVPDSEFIEHDLASLPVPQRQQLLLSAVAPRPIALVGSMDREGRVNLAPFSFFNAFGGNPAVIAVSPAYSGKTGKPKDTYLNIVATGEFTVSVVSHSMVDQVNLASCVYPPGEDEFIKAGFAKLPSKRIAPPGVAESPCVLECRLMQTIELGGMPGSGNLLIAEVLSLQVRKRVLDPSGRIDPALVDPVSRLGYEWYSRAKAGLFTLAKPPTDGCWMGVDALPRELRESPVLTGSDLARLASFHEPPSSPGPLNPAITRIFEEAAGRAAAEFHRLIQDLVRQEELGAAWDAIHYGEAHGRLKV